MQTKVCLGSVTTAPCWHLTFSQEGSQQGNPELWCCWELGCGDVVQSPFSEQNNDLAEVDLVAGFLVDSWARAHSGIYQMLTL